MLRIRLMRLGKKRQPVYRIVVAKALSSRDGKYLEKLGYYSPVLPGKPLELKVERLEYWVKRGAKLSEAVERLLVRKRKMEGGVES